MKLSIACLALAASLAVSPAAKAYTFSFGYTGYNSPGHTGDDVSGSLTGSYSGSVFDITGGTMTVEFGLGATGPGDTTSVTYDLYTGNADPYSGATSPEGLSYDNVVYQTSPYLDSDGLLFTEVGDPTNEIDISYIGVIDGSPTWELKESGGDYNVGSFVTFPPNPTHVVTPEPSSLLLLGTGLLGLAFVASRRAAAKSTARAGLRFGTL